MATNRTSASRVGWLPRAVAIGGGIFFAVFGLWAMAAPESFFEQFAKFEPYNQHLIQDIGAFQVGLGAVLLVAVFIPRIDSLATALFGVGIGSAAHFVSHLIGRDLGGTPETDLPFFAVVTLLLLGAGVVRLRRLG